MPRTMIAISNVRHDGVDALVIDLLVDDSPRESLQHQTPLDLFFITELGPFKVVLVDRTDDESWHQRRLHYLLHDFRRLPVGNVAIAKRFVDASHLLFNFDFFLRRQVGCFDPLRDCHGANLRGPLAQIARDPNNENEQNDGRDCNGDQASLEAAAPLAAGATRLIFLGLYFESMFAGHGANPRSRWWKNI